MSRATSGSRPGVLQHTADSLRRAATEAADANDPVGGLQAAGEAITRMDAFFAPLKELASVPELASAAEKAGACQDLRTLRPSETATPTS